MPADLAQYLASDDARSAERWQIAELTRFRLSLGTPLDIEAYVELRAAIMKHAGATELAAAEHP